MLETGTLNDRQLRERKFFNDKTRQMSEKDAPTSLHISFDSVLNEEQRPWNSYWYIDGIALKNFKTDKNKVLDFGCGFGARALKLARIGYDVWGFDVSSESIEMANTLSKKYCFGNKTEFKVGVAEQLDYLTDFFDGIYGVDILHHVEIEKAIAEVHRVLKKGGWAAFREHLRVPVFDAVRESKLIMRLFPKKVGDFDRCITEDERKLTKQDIDTLKMTFPNITIKRFCLLSRFAYILSSNQRFLMILEKIDYFVVRFFPFMKIFYGGIVITMIKD